MITTHEDLAFTKAKVLIKQLLQQVVSHPDQPLGIFRIVKVVERKHELDTKLAYTFVVQTILPLLQGCQRWQEPHKNWIVFKPDACNDCVKRVDCLVDPQGGL